ncbi:hypothetical protein ADUPG1_011791, partial [Aduncisulcus paluster]
MELKDIVKESDDFHVIKSNHVNNQVVVGLLSGVVKSYMITDEGKLDLMWECRALHGSIRDISFNLEGTLFVAGGSYGDIAIFNSSDGMKVWGRKDAHLSSVNCVYFQIGPHPMMVEVGNYSKARPISLVTSHLIVTGDDEGVIKLWDMRRSILEGNEDDIWDEIESSKQGISSKSSKTKGKKKTSKSKHKDSM